MKNKNHIGKFISIFLILLCSLMILCAFRSSFNQRESKIRYITYTVQPGDTLWSISKQTSPGRDPREVTWEIEKVNNITPIIQVGQELKVPVKE